MARTRQLKCLGAIACGPLVCLALAGQAKAIVVAEIESVSPSGGNAPITVTATARKDPEGTSTSKAWTCGGRNHTTTPYTDGGDTWQCRYTEPGTYHLVLRVTDQSDGQSSYDGYDIVVTDPADDPAELFIYGPSEIDPAAGRSTFEFVFRKPNYGVSWTSPSSATSGSFVQVRSPKQMADGLHVWMRVPAAPSGKITVHAKQWATDWNYTDERSVEATVAPNQPPYEWKLAKKPTAEKNGSRCWVRMPATGFSATEVRLTHTIVIEQLVHGRWRLLRKKTQGISPPRYVYRSYGAAIGLLPDAIKKLKGRKLRAYAIARIPGQLKATTKPRSVKLASCG